MGEPKISLAALLCSPSLLSSKFEMKYNALPICHLHKWSINEYLCFSLENSSTGHSTITNSWLFSLFIVGVYLWRFSTKHYEQGLEKQNMHKLNFAVNSISINFYETNLRCFLHLMKWRKWWENCLPMELVEEIQDEWNLFRILCKLRMIQSFCTSDSWKW